MKKIKWEVDPVHSEITFKVKHMMISNVTGILSDYKIEAETDDEQFSNPKIIFLGKAISISTGNEQRDAHLRSAEFFDVEKNPEIRFESTGYEKAADGYRMYGNLTVRGTTKPVTLDVEQGGSGKDPYGKFKAGFSVSGKINRKDFGLMWNAPVEKGGMLVSEDVKIACEIQMVKLG